MKKYFIIAAAIATMVSCQKNASLEVAPVAEDNAIGFSAYSPTTITKGESIDSKDFKEYGVGIFAFYQPAGSGAFNSKKNVIPDFMYNQKLEWTKAVSDSLWSYSPTKYWPNNYGDRVSFFAYAPYDSAKSWDDLKVKTDAYGTKLVASFAIADDVALQKDLLWAHPFLCATNKKDSSATPITYNPEYNQLNNVINFQFGHSSARVDIHVGVLNSKVTYTATGDLSSNKTDYAWDDANTQIHVKSIVFEDLYDGFEYVYSVGTDGTITKIDTTNTSASKFSLTVNPYKYSASINTTNWPADSLYQPTASEGYYRKYFAANGADEYLFLAPQEFTNEKVTITYVVETKVNPSATTSNLNDSYIINVISKKLSDVFSVTSGKLVNGQAYNLNFLIGMDDVNITTSLEPWKDAKQIHIDVPANK